MTAKLTLAFDEKVIRKAKQYASRHHTSVSSLVETFLKSITDEKSKKKEIEITPFVKSLSGIIKGPANAKEEDEIIYEYYSKKYK